MSRRVGIRCTKVARRCTWKDCTDPRVGRGLCAKHYRRLRTTGSVELREPTAACAAKDCPEPPRSRYAAHCEKHYTRVRRHGSVHHPGRFGFCESGCDRTDLTAAGQCRKCAAAQATARLMALGV